MGKRILLVEGKDDEHVVRHLCQAHKIKAPFQIEQSKGSEEEGDGVEYLIKQVPIRLKESDLQRLAVLVDADESSQNRWTRLRDRLRREGYGNIPDSPGKDGTIIDIPDEFGDKRLGVWIMPDNELPGVLEDFATFLVPEHDKMLAHVDRFLDGIPQEDRLFSETHRSKARVHSYLAVQEEPGKPLGLAITFRYLDPNCGAVEPFLQWINDVLIR